jgi:hypothetical protein
MVKALCCAIKNCKQIICNALISLYVYLLRVRLHVYDSVYDSAYDLSHNLKAIMKSLQILLIPFHAIDLFFPPSHPSSDLDPKTKIRLGLRLKLSSGKSRSGQHFG